MNAKVITKICNAPLKCAFFAFKDLNIGFHRHYKVNESYNFKKI